MDRGRWATVAHSAGGADDEEQRRPKEIRMRHALTFVATLSTLAAAPALAAGWTLNPGVWLAAPLDDSKQTSETRKRTDADGDATVESDDDESHDSSNALTLQVNLGAGYTLPSGLFVGGKGFYQYGGFNTKGSSTDEDGDGSESTSKDRTSLVAFGPSVGYTASGSFTAGASYFPRVLYSAESTTEWTSKDASASATTDRTTTYRSEDKRDHFRGYQLDVGYRFKVGKADVGPQLYFTRLTYDKQTSTSSDTTRSSGATSRASTSESESQTEGTFTVTQVTPVFGMWLDL
jgi:hypothetical protein